MLGEIDENLEEKVPSEEEKAASRQGLIDPKYQIIFENPLRELSTEFAKAYAVHERNTSSPNPNIYAIVFNHNFPFRLKVIQAYKKIRNPSLPRIFDHGKILIGAIKAERYAVITERPIGRKLSEIVHPKESFSEGYIAEKIMEQVIFTMETFAEAKIIHGKINPDHIYYDPETSRLMFGECLTDFCGYSQDPSYESLERLLCHKAGKGESSYAADYFAIGMVLLFMVTGRKPYGEISETAILDTRLEKGSCDATIAGVLNISGIRMSVRMNSLLRGLLTDHVEDRWGANEMRMWLRKQDISPPVSKMHKQAATGFLFDNKEYYGRRALAHDIFRKWNVAKRSLRITDISRWANLSMKRPDISEKLDYLTVAGQHEVILPDDKLSRIIMILDPEGPMRYKEFSSSIFGLGTILSFSYINKRNDYINNIGTIFLEGLIDSWIRVQIDPDYYSYTSLGWSPGKMRQFMRKKDIGFGMERCLYEFNRSLPCQSPIIGESQVMSLPDLLGFLDKVNNSSTMENDPVDRHIAAFIASKIDLMEEIKIKNLQNFPSVGKNPQVLMLGLLAVAQSEGRVRQVKGLSEWVNERLVTMTDKLHSKLIKKDLKSKLKAAAREGNLNLLFKIVSSPGYVQRDFYGFKEAKRQFLLLTYEINKLKQQRNIERMAYKMGLRISVTISYLVCIVTVLYMLLKSS